jgi:uncharacterized protein with ATP-grasp and redox domains
MRAVEQDSGAPALLMTSEEGSFAQGTILNRKPQIIRQVLAGNAYPADIAASLGSFIEEILHSTMRPLTEDTGLADEWNRALAVLGNPRWLDAPWYFAEVFFYRRLLEIVRYYQPGPWYRVDPFYPQKFRQTQSDLAAFALIWDQILTVDPAHRFEVVVHSALWGNRTDLSNFTTALSAAGGLAVSAEQHRILIDHTPDVQHLLQAGVSRVDFINDNVGSDLILDLALAADLLEQNWTRQVVMHLKAQPFFVSDAMPEDARMTIEQMGSLPGSHMQALAAQMNAWLGEGRLVFKRDPFWNSFYFFTELQPHIRAELEGSDLIIIKGDANYRRVIEDRHWPHTARVEELNHSLPRPFLLLRTLKAELMAGLDPGEAEQLAAEDPNWLTNGVRGVIHLVTQ